MTFDFTDAQVAAFVDGVVLASDHSEYLETVKLLPPTVAELRAELLPEALRVVPPARGAQKRHKEGLALDLSTNVDSEPLGRGPPCQQ